MDTRYFNIKICHNLFTQSPYCWTFSFIFPLPLSLHLLCSLPLILFSSFHGQVFSDINTGYFQVSLAAAYTSCSHSCSGRLPYLPHLTDYSQTRLSSMALGYSALKTTNLTFVNTINSDWQSVSVWKFLHAKALVTKIKNLPTLLLLIVYRSVFTYN